MLLDIVNIEREAPFSGNLPCRMQRIGLIVHRVYHQFIILKHRLQLVVPLSPGACHEHIYVPNTCILHKSVLGCDLESFSFDC